MIMKIISQRNIMRNEGKRLQHKMLMHKWIAILCVWKMWKCHAAGTFYAQSPFLPFSSASVQLPMPCESKIICSKYLRFTLSSIFFFFEKYGSKSLWTTGRGERSRCADQAWGVDVFEVIDRWNKFVRRRKFIWVRNIHLFEFAQFCNQIGIAMQVKIRPRAWCMGTVCLGKQMHACAHATWFTRMRTLPAPEFNWKIS